ncbi:MAG: sulfatase-like hydrolase/transferase [Acidobacteria bacterium]|nr:sulfatase-like hydrolase/transferase [Acidobacteriota bacterium]
MIDSPFSFMRGLRTWAFLLLLSPATAYAADRPNIILITLDTVRADRMGFNGSKRGLTPQLDSLAAQSIVFERAYSQAPLTPVSHASLLTGTYPQFHKVQDFGARLGDALPYLPALLRAQGYKTAAFVSSIILDPKNGFAPGFERGFDTYDAGFHRKIKGETRQQSMERRAEVTLARALEWLAKNPQGPFFIWIHLWDAHDPYEAPAPFAQKYRTVPYDAEIAYMDSELGKFFAALDSRKLLASSLLAIASDHGEGLGGHGENTHGILLYDDTIHVPLVIKLPQGKSAGVRVKARAGLVDVTPTLLEGLQIPVPPQMQGQSLLRVVGMASPPDRPVFSETAYPERAFGWSKLAALRAGNFLFVRGPNPELYDTAADASAKINVAEKNKTVAARMATQMEDFLKRTTGSQADAKGPDVDPKMAEQLASLGYVASSRSAGAAASGVDPRSRISIANDMHDANIAIENGEQVKAIPVLERIVKSEPQIQIAHYYLGMAYARDKAYARAVPELRKAIEMNPNMILAHFEIGLALFETGDLQTALKHFEIVVDKNPNWGDARFSLASIQARTDHITEAAANLVLVVEQNPNHYRGNLLLGRILSLRGQNDVAVPYLEKAVSVNPESPEAHSFLADAYGKLGRAADAQRERGEAQKRKRQ